MSEKLFKFASTGFIFSEEKRFPALFRAQHSTGNYYSLLKSFPINDFFVWKSQSFRQWFSFSLCVCVYRSVFGPWFLCKEFPFGKTYPLVSLSNFGKYSWSATEIRRVLLCFCKTDCCFFFLIFCPAPPG